jgi:hypothetical protein
MLGCFEENVPFFSWTLGKESNLHFQYFNLPMSNTAGNAVAGRAVDITSNPVYEFNGDEKGMVRCSVDPCDVPHRPGVLSASAPSTDTPVLAVSAQAELLSHSPDFNSILNVDGKIFSITQYESPRPGVAYLTELAQNKATGELTVCADDTRASLLCRCAVDMLRGGILC